MDDKRVHVASRAAVTQARSIPACRCDAAAGGNGPARQVMKGLKVEAETSVDVTVTQGDVPQPVCDYVAAKIRDVAASAPAPVLSARATIAVSTNPAQSRPVMMKASLDVNGRPVRAHVAAVELYETADLLVERLRHGLEVLTSRRLARRTAPAAPTPGEWRHGMAAESRPPYFPRPAEEREIVRRKTYAYAPMSLEEAAEEMVLLNHDFHVFTERDRGVDAMVELDDAGVVRLTVAAVTPQAAGLEESTSVAATAEVGEAVRALEDGQLPRVFFVDRDSGRGTVVYRRYDGHYGLVTAGDAG